MKPIRTIEHTDRIVRAVTLLAVLAVACGCTRVEDSRPVENRIATSDQTLEIIRFGNGIYTMSESERIRVYESLSGDPDKDDPVQRLRLAIAAHSISDIGRTKVPSAYLEDLDAHRFENNHTREFSRFVSNLIGQGRATSVNECRYITKKYQALDLETKALREDCAKLETQIEGLLRLESEMNDRVIDSVE